MSLAKLHNNPGNVKNNPSNRWKGAPSEDKRGHAIFETLPLGIRAMNRNLQRCIAKTEGRLIDVISRWSPASDTVGSIPGASQNNPMQYARFITSRTGLPVDTRILYFDDKGGIRETAIPLLLALLRAMTEYESGGDLNPSMSDWLEGLALYQRDFVEGVR